MGSTKLALILLICMNIAYVNCRKGRNFMKCCRDAKSNGVIYFKEKFIDCCEERFIDCGITKTDIETAALQISPYNCEMSEGMRYLTQRCIDNMKLHAITKKQFLKCTGFKIPRRPSGFRPGLNPSGPSEFGPGWNPSGPGEFGPGWNPDGSGFRPGWNPSGPDGFGPGWNPSGPSGFGPGWGFEDDESEHPITWDDGCECPDGKVPDEAEPDYPNDERSGEKEDDDTNKKKPNDGRDHKPTEEEMELYKQKAIDYMLKDNCSEAANQVKKMLKIVLKDKCRKKKDYA